jgi:acetolactate decarboxylase
MNEGNHHRIIRISQADWCKAGLIILVLALLSGCTGTARPGAKNIVQATQASVENRKRETLFQISSINSLFSGHYDGLAPLSWIKERGDLGIGTFDRLNGEMIVLDGHVYQALADGSVVEPPDSTLTPFANVTTFDADITKQVASVASFADLQKLLLELMPRKDAFYAIRIQGAFKNVKVRTVGAQEKPYLPLETVLKNPVVFTGQDVQGTIVGFWSPDYVGEINLPGYNLHFISADHRLAGHLVEAEISDLQIALDETRNFEVTLNPNGD